MTDDEILIAASQYIEDMNTHQSTDAREAIAKIYANDIKSWDFKRFLDQVRVLREQNSKGLN